MEYAVQMESVSAESIGLPFVRSVVRITRTCTPTKPGSQPSIGIRTYVTDKECLLVRCGARGGQRRAREFADLSRGQWSIENKNHWKKDSLWGDDAPRQKLTAVARTLSLLRGALLAHVVEPLVDVFAKCQKYDHLAFKIVKSTLKPLY